MASVVLSAPVCPSCFRVMERSDRHAMWQCFCGNRMPALDITGGRLAPRRLPDACGIPLMGMATGMTTGSCVYIFHGGMADERIYNFTSPLPAKQDEKAIKKALKSEAKAQALLRDIIGLDQWQVYRKTNRVVVLGKYDWLIGNVFGNYKREFPLLSKPDVVRIDGKAKLETKYYGTSFCVEDRSGERMPYTDKVLAFAMWCSQDEVGFYKLANSIGEKTFNKIPECAIFKAA